MATRCIIQVEGLPNIILYKHFDGYPSATLPWLQKFNREYRRNQPDYKFAQLVRSSVTLASEFDLDTSTETGWGICHVDRLRSHTTPIMGEEFAYKLLEDGDVTYNAICDTPFS